MSLSRLPPPPEWAEPSPDYEDPPDYVPSEAEVEVVPLEVLRLGELMRVGVPAPTMVDEWLYAGALTSIQSEPGVGKSWLALWLAKRQLEAGRSVAYLDEEGGPELVTERLLALGADPAMVDERLCYLPFPQRKWGVVDQGLLAEVLDDYHKRFPLAAGYLDSLPDFLAAADADEDRAPEVTRFIAKMLPAFRERDAALVALDHLKKPEKGEKRSRYARGSGAKLAKAAATILVETETPFDAATSGKLRVWKTKDRRGRLRLPELSKPALMLDVVVDQGTVRIVEGAPPEPAPAWEGPTKAMDAIEACMKMNAEERFSGNSMVTRLKALNQGRSRATVYEALERLAQAKRISREAGPRGGAVYWWPPGEGDSPASPPLPLVDEGDWEPEF